MASFQTGAASRAKHRFTIFLFAALALSATYVSSFQPVESLLPVLAARILPPAQSSGAVAVVAIDAASLAAYGAWPWPRERLAEVIRRLQRFGPERIGVMWPLSDYKTHAVLGALAAELKQLDDPLQKKAAGWLNRLDSDARLAHAMKKAGNVVLFAPYRKDTQQQGSPQLTQRYLHEAILPQAGWRRVLARLLNAPAAEVVRPQYPAPLFLDSAVGVGVGELYRQNAYRSGAALVFNGGSGYLPGFELALLAGERDIRIMPGSGITMAGQPRLRTPDLVYYPRPADAVPVYSLQKLLRDDTLKARLRNRTLLLGLTAPGRVAELVGPAGRVYSPVTWSAQVLDSLHSGSAFVMPGWFFAGQRALLLLFALYLVLVPVHWHARRAPLATLLLAALVLNAGVMALVVRGIWLPVVAPVLFAGITQLALSLGWWQNGKLRALREELLDTRVSFGEQLRGQGRLDPALAQYTACLPAPVALEPLYELGLEYERRRQLPKAQAVYARLEASVAGYRDCARRSRELAALSARFPGGKGVVNQTLVLDSPVMELPVLGRYRLERELGRGAMGTVYLAVDPAIGRQVAIKTLSLPDSCGDREQEAAAQRFFREAEAVGRLVHPHIVSIHDAGREHDVAYLVMDYVQGESLDARVHRDRLLPVWEVLDIAAQVADGLHYAHSRNVIHRDVKPGNILYDRDSGEVRITDFGVARILDSTQTRTGTVLGTPSYMSPEQVAGRKIQGQSDQFSLGVTLYQLLTGSLPFCGDSVATLMYQIANRKMVPLRKQRSGLPACVSRMVGRAMHKDPAKRFASSAELAVAIRKCRLQFRGGRRKTA